MAVWENLQASPLEVTNWAAIIQQSISCSTHKHIWMIHALRLLKVGVLEQTREAGLGGSQGQRRDPQTQFIISPRPQQRNSTEDSGCNSALSKLEGHRQQSGLGGWHTLRLRFKLKVQSREAVQTTNHHRWTKKSADVGFPPPPPAHLWPAQQ